MFDADAVTKWLENHAEHRGEKIRIKSTRKLKHYHLLTQQGHYKETVEGSSLAYRKLRELFEYPDFHPYAFDDEGIIYVAYAGKLRKLKYELPVMLLRPKTIPENLQQLATLIFSIYWQS